MTESFKVKIITAAAIALVILSIFLVFPKVRGRINHVNTEHEGRIKIGLSMDSLVIERWETDCNIFVAKAKELGADVIVQTANNDTEDQINQIKYLIDQNVDVLVIVPHDSDALDSVVNTAKKKGIKIIAYDRLIKKAGVDLYISFDNEKVGQLMGEALKSKVPKGNYLVINGGREDYNTHFVNEGFKKVIAPEIDKGNIRIVDEVWSISWMEEDAYNCVENALTKGIKIDAIMAGDDRLAEAAIQALAERRLAGSVFVVGQDADLGGCQRVVEGTQLMTVYKPLRIIAEKAAEYAVRLAKNESIETNTKIFDGKQYVPFQMENPIAVYRNNMVDTIIKDNFHSMEDVYRNIPKDQWPAPK